MRDYHVEKGFMAHQFGALPIYCIGIEVNALATAGSYNCTIGKERKRIVVSYDEALNLVEEFGKENVIKFIGGKEVFIIPVHRFEKKFFESKQSNKLRILIKVQTYGKDDVFSYASELENYSFDDVEAKFNEALKGAKNYIFS